MLLQLAVDCTGPSDRANLVAREDQRGTVFVEHSGFAAYPTIRADFELYEVRRETVMRQARGFIGGDFLPSSADDLVAQAAGTQQSGFILQVYGYWDMVAVFVIHGALAEALVYDTCQEMYFQYSKIQPYLAGFREKMNLPEWMRSLQSVAEYSEASRPRVRTMRENVDRMAAPRKKRALPEVRRRKN